MELVAKETRIPFRMDLLAYWQADVLGSSGKPYTCYASCHFCSCPAFAFSVLRKSDSLLCKHLLAIYLSQALGTCQELTVSNKQLTSLLLMEDSLS
ncbi:UNVERIFIED_CONTAM: Zinc finger SWIM domain-containing protein 7 [Gekko kuhli]